jgi:hypothetical protein
MRVFMMFKNHVAKFFDWNSGIEIPNYYGICYSENGKIKWFTDIENGERSFTVLEINGNKI